MTVLLLVVAASLLGAGVGVELGRFSKQREVDELMLSSAAADYRARYLETAVWELAPDRLEDVKHRAVTAPWAGDGDLYANGRHVGRIVPYPHRRGAPS